MAVTPIDGSKNNFVPTPIATKNGTTVSENVATKPFNLSGKPKGFGTCSFSPFFKLNFFIPCTLKSSSISSIRNISTAMLLKSDPRSEYSNHLIMFSIIKKQSMNSPGHPRMHYSYLPAGYWFSLHHGCGYGHYSFQRKNEPLLKPIVIPWHQ